MKRSARKGIFYPERSREELGQVVYGPRLRDGSVTVKVIIPTFPKSKSGGEEDGGSAFAGQPVTVEGEGMPNLWRIHRTGQGGICCMKDPALD